MLYSTIKSQTVKMKIAKIELFKVPPRWLFLKITTDDGIEGWGEPVVEGKASTVKAAVEEFAEVFRECVCWSPAAPMPISTRIGC
jgi:L-alanine-DL-glutamate epimerase-like enolase superfamily enzyme